MPDVPEFLTRDQFISLLMVGDRGRTVTLRSSR